MIDRFQRDLHAEVRGSLEGNGWEMPPISQTLLNQVVGAGGTPEGFLYGGFTTAVALRATLKLYGKTFATAESVLDFGCGPGRVMKWLNDHQGANLYGADVNDDAIQWCHGNHLAGQFIRNEAFPPLLVPDSTFDIVYAISVLTHLDEQHQLDWLRELRRVLRPGGLLLTTINGRNKARRALDPDTYRRYAKHGFLFCRPDERVTLEGLPQFYQMAFHSREYVLGTWSRFFDVVSCISHGPVYEQELVVLRKSRPSRLEPRETRLPLACLDAPSPASTVRRNEVTISGWAFFHERRGPVILDVWLDGRHAGQCAASGARPDVGAVFRSRHAERSGFCTAIPVNSTEAVHTVWLTCRDEPIPLAASFFVA